MLWSPWTQIILGAGGVMFVLWSDRRRRAGVRQLQGAATIDAAYLAASLLLLGAGVVRVIVGAGVTP